MAKNIGKKIKKPFVESFADTVGADQIQIPIGVHVQEFRRAAVASLDRVIILVPQQFSLGEFALAQSTKQIDVFID